jgi:hypothetical protein
MQGQALHYSKILLNLCVVCVDGSVPYAAITALRACVHDSKHQSTPCNQKYSRYNLSTILFLGYWTSSFEVKLLTPRDTDVTDYDRCLNQGSEHWTHTAASKIVKWQMQPVSCSFYARSKPVFYKTGQCLTAKVCAGPAACWQRENNTAAALSHTGAQNSAFKQH